MKNDSLPGANGSSPAPALAGIVLSGGESSRMGSDKGDLDYHGLPQRLFLYKLLLSLCDTAFISCNLEQASGITGVPLIVDAYPKIGPLGGIVTALEANPGKAILTVPCDLPLLDRQTVAYLIRHREPSKIATTFVHNGSKRLEPLITVWEPESLIVVQRYVNDRIFSPYRILEAGNVEVVSAPGSRVFKNVNTAEEYDLLLKCIAENKA